MEDHQRQYRIHMPRLHRRHGRVVAMEGLGHPCGRTPARDRTVILQQRRLHVEPADMLVFNLLHDQITARDRIVMQRLPGVEREIRTSPGNEAPTKLPLVE